MTTTALHEGRAPLRHSAACLICGGTKLTPYLDLGRTALANSYLTPRDLGKPEFTAPLVVHWCHTCHLAQLLDIVDRELLFRDYAYFSSTSPQLFQHFGEYAEDVMRRYPNQAKRLVLEIASNDGILLEPFKARGCKVLGVDPARNVAETANAKGIPTMPEFFGVKLVPEILAQHGPAGVVTANNVLAHTDTLHDIVAGTKAVLAPDGIFVFEAQYLADLLDHNEFDNTYHEHICYFSFSPLEFLLERHGLKVIDVQHVGTQGGSLRVFASHAAATFTETSAVGALRAVEHERGLDRAETFLAFSARPAEVKKRLTTLLGNLKKNGKRIAGYGAPAKGNTLLQYCGLGNETFDYLVDTAPSKQGTYAPGSHIPIFHPDHAKGNRPDYLVILAWNYADSIRERERWFTDAGGTFIVPIPEPQVFATA